MTLFAIVTSVACATYIYLGLLTLIVDNRSAVHRAFAALCAAFMVWSFGTTGQNLAISGPARPVFDRISYTGAELYSLFGLIFFLHLSKNERKKGFRFAVSVAVGVIAIQQFMNWRWNLIADGFPYGFWHLSHHATVNSVNVFGLIMTARWGASSKFRRERIQAALIFTGTMLGIVIGLAIDYGLNGLGYPSLTCALPLLWMIVIFVAIIRYGLMRFTPAQVSREIVSSIDEAVFLIDNEWNISDLNDAALSLTRRKEADRGPSSIDEVFALPSTIKQYLLSISVPGNGAKSRTVLLRARNGAPVLVRADFHVIADRWNDLIGILCICRPQKDVDDLIKNHGLSRREADMLRYAITGCSQTETAEALGLSLPTIKTHTTGLYNKLGISSRNGLYVLLRDEGVNTTGIQDTSATVLKR